LNACLLQAVDKQGRLFSEANSVSVLPAATWLWQLFLLNACLLPL